MRELVLCSLLWVSGGLFGCGQRTAGISPGGGGNADSTGLLRVVVAHPTPSEGSQTLLLPGTLVPFEEASLYARVTGYIDTVSVDLGDVVEADAELARIIAPERTAESQRTGAEIERADASIERAQADAELARLTHERLTRLAASELGAVSRQQVDEAASRVRLAEADLRLARAARRVARAEAMGARALDRYRTIRAPFAGRITARHLHPGGLAREGTTSGAVPLFDIARIDPLRVRFEVPEPLVPHVRAGTPITLRFGPGSEPIETTVSRASGALDTRTRSMRAESDLPNAEGQRSPGAYVGVEITIDRLAGAPMLPSRAIRGVGDERYVLVADREGVLHRAGVAIASDDGRFAVLASGVSMTDRVVVAGSVLARDGTRAEVTEQEAE